MINILEETSDYIVCIKPIDVDSEKAMVNRLSQQLNCSVYCIHRLDKNVGGVMVYAKTPTFAACMSRQIQEGSFEKKYLCIIEGSLENKDDRLEDFLYHDRNKNRSYLVKKERKGVKKAILLYRTLADIKNYSLLEITLITGRTHQIRCQLSGRQKPLVGDRRYGSHIDSDICLFSHELSFNDRKNEKHHFRTIPDTQNPYWALFVDIL